MSLLNKNKKLNLKFLNTSLKQGRKLNEFFSKSKKVTWDNISEEFPDLSLNDQITFLKREDRLLISAIEKKGCQKWSEISPFLKWRTSKQCRERWKNKLDPKISTDPLTEEEIHKLEKLLDKIGTHWAKIVKHFPNRSDLILKNYYYTKLRSNKKEKEKNQVEELLPKKELDNTRNKRRKTSPRKRYKKIEDTNVDCKKKKKTCIQKSTKKNNQKIINKIQLTKKNNKNNNKILIFPINKEQKNPIFRNTKDEERKNELKQNDGTNLIQQTCESFLDQEKQDEKEIKMENEQIINLNFFKSQNDKKSSISHEQKKHNFRKFVNKHQESNSNTDGIFGKKNRQLLNENGEIRMKFLTKWSLSSIQEIDFSYFESFSSLDGDLNSLTRFSYNDSALDTYYFEDIDLINLDFEFPDRFFY
ncbi:myb protein-related [Anaeramoeba flamelloides]|uniref:Myb protein-related n=1 Tax=Anaeramoeba flamelloides TaxID=1746091 RepID=A0AAV7YMF5_9EUKA|nr:myb protein-related [Anaeramoeba flamelloides]